MLCDYVGSSGNVEIQKAEKYKLFRFLFKSIFYLLLIKVRIFKLSRND